MGYQLLQIQRVTTVKMEPGPHFHQFVEREQERTKSTNTNFRDTGFEDSSKRILNIT
jgi:hypothetical protein